MTPTLMAEPRRRPPTRALVFSLLALAVPIAATAWAPEWTETDGALLVWLPALLPPFLLSYYKGWRGASLALAGGMATLALTQVETLLLDLETPPASYVFAVIVLLLAVALGAGWIAELLHRERDSAAQAALTDPLTGLPNRRHASVFLDAAWGAVQRGRSVSVVLFDLDNFKFVNDVWGHNEGDRVIRTLAEILGERTRRMDLSARFGGEEFLTVLMDCAAPQAEVFAERVRATLGEVDFGWGRVTLSAGICSAETAMGSPDVLLAAADRALYEAKARGRNQVVRASALPQASASTAPAPDPAAAQPRSTLDGCRVLLVDDDDLTLRATTRVLRRLGCVVTPIASPQKALSVLAGGDEVDVLVTDIIMPDMGGFTLADVAGKARPGLPVLYVSGYAREEVYWGGTPGVRAAFLAKPLDADELRATLLGLLRPAPAPRPPEPGLPPTAPTPPVLQGAPQTPPPGVSSTSRDEREDVVRTSRILIVDDDETVVSTLQRFFQRAGYPRPLALTDPRLVLDTLRQQEVDLVLLDLSMPEMDGLQVMGAISKVLDEEEFLPVVMLTGSDDPATRRKALASGVMDFMNKPLDPMEAEVRVRNLLTTRLLTKRVARQRDLLEQEVAARTSELADTRSEILYRLARAAEYRDDVTGRHAERVGLLSSAIGSTLGLPPREVDLLRRTGPLHDIGKIGVPDSILLKPGGLTDAEFEIMKSHTTIGAQILGGSTHRLLEVARNIALYHHERWDSKGYPEGLAGGAIPLEARVVAVADAFDTISHARPYKAALAPADALEEIRRCAGTHYDPDVVRALEAVRDRVGLEHLHEISAPLDPRRDVGPDVDHERR